MPWVTARGGARGNPAAHGHQHVVIGFMTYAEIGIAALILLTVLRFLQGLGVGGEWGGVAGRPRTAMGRRGFYASWPQAGVPLGLLTSTGVMAAVPGALVRGRVPGVGPSVPVLPELP